jgi:hypothetical protein
MQPSVARETLQAGAKADTEVWRHGHTDVGGVDWTKNSPKRKDKNQQNLEYFLIWICLFIFKLKLLIRHSSYRP